MLIFLTAPYEKFSAKSTVDDKIIKSIALGDMDAFHKLYENIYGSIYGFALSITKNTHDAEDVLQDTFLTIYNCAESYTPMGKPMAWIFTIARNSALMKIRKNSKTGETEGLQLEDSDAFSRIISTEDRMLLSEMLCTLDDEERQIIMLHAVSGMKNREIAELLSIPIGTVLSKYHRAIKKLRQKAQKEDFSK